jgi:ribonuclease P protein component
MQSVYRLKKNSQFEFTYKRGKSLACRDLVLVYARTNSGTLKAGFSVSKKIGKSVVRNKVKRRLREAFNKHIPNLKQNYNYVFIARKTIAEADFKSMEDSVNYLLKKAALFKEAVKKPVNAESMTT